ncbi:cyclopropane-fatty-acyl-phospholipid synthase [Thalassobaculum fulvum]|uniref:Cyclopropane-fatty-acyl-phospholipid synthase n=1 Tax=Thalassobaculum fulvum TaxID=1633335 RepID=A0A918XNG4_9PROT|nr:class I SAM-dependent methyltransferase [Thalassobaculum fulvum]GHD40718.1 cyclopropane-fatty-acyl-phospholipid synthase [Thalassobaculum fulvum]
MSDEAKRRAALRLAALIRETVDAHFSLRLWDGTLEPLGTDPVAGLALRIASPGVISSLLHRPSLDRLIRHYAKGDIAVEGGSLIDFAEPLMLDRSYRRRFRRIAKGALIRGLLPFFFGRGDDPDRTRDFGADSEGRGRKGGDNRRFIRFHYDVGNDFYRLFLDPEMQYSCAHFPHWDATLEEAQLNKLDLICRKLRLKPGETLLDIGCGWGGLLCHAVRSYGVVGHGVTLSAEQLAFAQAKVERLGIADRVTLHLKDYRELASTAEGGFDKIASVGMYEHIGLAAIPEYFRTVQRLLKPGGLFMNHAISRGAKRRRRRFAGRPEQRALQKYIFPGGELDDIGHTIAEMEIAGFEVQDVEALRQHYQKTTREWHRRLYENREAAEALVGPETTRIWAAYLAGCSFAFQRGSARIYQTLASKSPKGFTAVPPTRHDIYRI